VILPVLGIRRGQVVAVAGAGGKTTLVYTLAREARELGLSVLVTTTTHMGTLPEAVTGPVFVEADGNPEPALRSALEGEGRATLLGRRVRDDKLEGLAPERVDALAALADVVLVEADGARGRSLKVPAPHEPVVPRSATHLVVVCGLDVLGAPLDDGLVHRVELVSAATGIGVGEVVDEDGVAAALRHATGYLARAPRVGRRAVFLNKVEDEGSLQAAGRLARRLVPPYHLVVAGSARSGDVRAWPPVA
jgi:probable selenium-dependent hydroxylase accessory protein YqeC